MANFNYNELAKQLWSSLDDLAENDPQKYEQLIHSQIENLSPTPNNSNKALLKDSQHGFSIKTTLEKETIRIREKDLNTKVADYYVNFFHSNKLSSTSKGDKSVPPIPDTPIILLGNRRISKKVPQRSITVDVVITSENYNRCNKDLSFKDYVILLTLLKLQTIENKEASTKGHLENNLKVISDPLSIVHLNNKPSEPFKSQKEASLPKTSNPLIEVIESSTYEDGSDSELPEAQPQLDPSTTLNECSRDHFISERRSHYYSKKALQTFENKTPPTISHNVPNDNSKQFVQSINSKITPKKTSCDTLQDNLKYKQNAPPIGSLKQILIVSYQLEIPNNTPGSFKLYLKLDLTEINSNYNLDMLGDGKSFIIFLIKSGKCIQACKLPSPFQYDLFKVKSFWKPKTKWLEIQGIQ